ncbi:MAG TPA: class I SAM-dependent methyltransferase [Candidatus Acidoferrales bacterium]
MKEDTASNTAWGVAKVRAFHQLFDAEPKILEDPVIVELLDAKVREEIQARAAERDEPRFAAFRGHIVLRNRYAEDCLREAVSRGVRQYVLLGAGYDTFAYRQPSWAADLTIFEVDHPASQAAKRELLARGGVALPGNLRFADVNFESESLRAGLARAGLDVTRTAFFSCLGVLVYLDERAIAGLFEFVGSMAAGSEFVFTFSQPDTALDAREAESRAKITSTVSGMGEPWRSYFEPERLREMLVAAGFSAVAFFTPEEAEERYFRGRTDALKPPRHVRLGRAVR